MNQDQVLPPIPVSASRAHTPCRQSRLQADGSSRVRTQWWLRRHPACRACVSWDILSQVWLAALSHPASPGSSRVPGFAASNFILISYLIAFQIIPSRGVLFCVVLTVAFQQFHHCHFAISVTHKLMKSFLKKPAIQDFPGAPVVQNMPCNAGNVGSISGWGTKIPHAVGATKPVCQNYRTCTLQQKIPLVTTKTQCSQTNT